MAVTTAKEDVTVTDPVSGTTKRLRAGRPVPPYLLDAYKKASKSPAKDSGDDTSAKAEKSPPRDKAERAPERDKAESGPTRSK